MLINFSLKIFYKKINKYKFTIRASIILKKKMSTQVSLISNFCQLKLQIYANLK